MKFRIILFLLFFNCFICETSAQINGISVYQIEFYSCEQKHAGVIILNQNIYDSFARILVNDEYIVEESIKVVKSEKEKFHLKLMCNNPRYIPSNDICLSYSPDNFYLDTLSLQMVNLDNSFRNNSVTVKLIKDKEKITELYDKFLIGSN